MKEVLFLIKFEDGQIKGPYSNSQIFDLIYDAVLSGKERICEYPGGQWIDIGKDKKFYDAFMGQFKIDQNNTVLDQNTIIVESDKSSLSSLENLSNKNDFTAIFDNKDKLIKVKENYISEENSPLIPEAVFTIEKRKELYKKENSLKKAKDIIFLIILAVSSYFIYNYYKQNPIKVEPERINIDSYSFSKNYLDIKLPEVESTEYKPNKANELFIKALSLINKDDLGSIKSALDILHEAVLYDVNNYSILSLISVAYSKLTGISRNDSEYINAINSIIYRAEKGDTNIQNLTQAQMYFKIINGDPSGALSVFTDVSKYIKTLDPLTLLVISEAYYYNKDYNSSYKALQNITNSENNQYPRAYYLMGLINLINKQTNLAEENFRTALKINEKHTGSKTQIILMGLEDKKNTEILKFIQDNIEELNFADVSKLLFLVGKNQFKVGKTKLAKKLIETSLDFDSTNKEAVVLFEEIGGDVKKYFKDKGFTEDVDLAKFQKFVIRGDYLFSNQDYRDAILQYRMATSVNPKDIIAWYKLGESYRKTYDSDKAIDSYKKVLEINKLFLPALTKLSRTYIDIYDLESASIYLKTAKNIDPDNPDVLYTLGFLYDKHGKEYEALKYFHQALVNDFSNVDCLYELGKRYFDSKDYEKARLQFEKIISVQPNYYGAYIYLVQISSITQHEFQFKKYIDGSLSLFPSIAEINASYAMAYMEKQNIQEAQKQLEIALSKNKYSIVSLLTFANLNRMLGNFKEAIKFLNTVSIIAPYYFQAISMRINLYKDLGDFENMEKELLSLSKLSPYYPGVFYELASLYFYSGKTTDAMTCLQNQIEFQPNNFDAYVFLGDLYLDQGKTSEAISLYRKLLSKNPKNPYGLVGMALSCYNSQDFECAQTFVSQARTLDSSIPEIYLLECKIFEKIDQKIEAMDRCSEFLRMAPDHYRIKEAKELLEKLQRSFQ